MGNKVWEAICKGLAPNDLQAVYRNGMTREEFCHLMITLLEKTGQGIDAYLASKSLPTKVLGLTAGGSENFVDAEQFASWAGESIAFVLGLTDPTTDGKSMGGTGNGSFSPNRFYTRE